MTEITGRKSGSCSGSIKENLSGQVQYAELQSMENTGKCYIYPCSGVTLLRTIHTAGALMFREIILW
jgi:hypothetical protein